MDTIVIIFITSGVLGFVLQYFLSKKHGYDPRLPKDILNLPFLRGRAYILLFILYGLAGLFIVAILALIAIGIAYLPQL